MAIHVICRHCGTTLFAFRQDDLLTSRSIRKLKEEFSEEFFHQEHKGDWNISTTCETCEKHLQENPQLFEIEKWVQ
ncbi:anti-sigma-F factor Fin [Paenisporosarcina cavernae]|uniref:anti-sigma-F factor Fin n=1 Tax=Paenisporosarcina cavernae TaxID=2320858 RepID=UPI0013C53381|nr:anti-sigma-F factor Fin [Paenisporosarcina cavernae]